MAEQEHEERIIGTIATMTLAAVAIVLSAGALIVAAATNGDDIAVSPAATATDTAGSTSSAPAETSVELSEFAIAPSDLAVAAGGTIEVTNAGAVEHDFMIVDADLGTPMLAAGDSQPLALGDLEPGDYEVHCSVPGHASGGMTATLTVVGAASATPVTDAQDAEAADTSDASAHGEDTDWAALDTAMHDSIMAFPAQTAGTGNQLLEPEEVLDDGTKVFRLVAERFDWEVEPGKIVDGWGYNDQIPGPMIKLDVGDRVQVIVENELPLGTDVHWHGVRVPNAQDGVAPLTQDLIQPGDSFTYEFTADEPAIGMYHPHHHGQMKLPNGMFGAFIIGDVGDDIPWPTGTIGGREIPEDLEIAAEIPMILNDAGTVGLSLNGKSFPATEPIVVKEDDWVVIHYYNEGLTSHPMHLHQMPQLVFAKDGFPVDNPQWEDTIDVAPGERFSVLVNAADPGVWVFHCHILTHAERETGMFGMVTAMIVE